jgi:hypothetical protein
LIGTLALAGMSGGSSFRADVQDRFKGLEWYWDGRAFASYVLFPYGDGGDRFADDNAWVALASVQAHRMGLTPSLDRPRKVLGYARSQWDRRLGGLFWVDQRSGMGRHNHDRGAGATAGHAQLAYHLQDVETGNRLLDWVTTHMDASGSGRGPFWNAMRDDASIDTNVWSYNQGVVIGAYLTQYRLVQDAQSLRFAEDVARQTLETFGDFTRQPPSFNAMCFQNMLMLHALTSDAQLQARMLGVMRAYADWTWDEAAGARDPATDLFYFDDAGTPAHGKQAARLQDQGALLQLYALLEWDPAEYHLLT